MGEKNNIKDIIANYEAMSQTQSGKLLDEKSLLQLIEYYTEEEQWEMVLEVSETSLERYPFSVEFFIAQAEALIATKQLTDALDTLAQAKLLAPNETEILLLQLHASIDLNQLEDAQDLMEYLHQLEDASIECDLYLAKAKLFQKQEEFENVFFLLKDALQKHPFHKGLLERFGASVELNKYYEESVHIHNQILDKDPYTYLAWYNLGTAYSYLGNYVKAIEAFEFAFVINEQFEAAGRSCAELCFELKLFHKSKKYFQELLEINDTDPEIYLRLGQSFLQLGDIATARTFLAKALYLDSQNDEAYFAMAQCFAAEGKWQQAIQYYEKAIAIEDTQEEYYAAYAEALMEIDEWNKAEENLLLALEIAPECNLIWIQYALLLLYSNQGEDAVALLEQAEEFTSAPEIVYCKIACLFALGKRQEALYWLGEALHEDFSQHTSLFEYLPELQGDPGILNMISAYIP